MGRRGQCSFAIKTRHGRHASIITSLSNIMSELFLGKCLGVYRGHEGTVYSLDVSWKFGEPDDQEVSIKQVSPTQKLNISLFTGTKCVFLFKDHTIKI